MGEVEELTSFFSAIREVYLLKVRRITNAKYDKC